VLVGSREHYGWQEEVYVVVGLHPGALAPTEFLQVRRGQPEKPSLFLRQRFGDADWSNAGVGEIAVAGWYGEQVPDGVPFAPSTTNADAWLYVMPGESTGSGGSGGGPTDGAQ
jgi:hypothetical protein